MGYWEYEGGLTLKLTGTQGPETRLSGAGLAGALVGALVQGSGFGPDATCVFFALGRRCLGSWRFYAECA